MLKHALKSTTKPPFNKRLITYIREEHADLRANYTSIRNATSAEEKNRARNKLTSDVTTHTTGDVVVLCREFEKRLPDGVEKEAALHVMRQNSDVGAVKRPPSDLGPLNATTWEGVSVWPHLWCVYYRLSNTNC